MNDDEFETHVMSGGPPPLPAETHDPDTPPRMPDLVRMARPRADSFRTSEAYLVGQIARAVARGQRVL